VDAYRTSLHASGPWTLAAVLSLREIPLQMTHTVSPRTLGGRVIGIALILMGAGAAAVALLGPLVGDVIQYHASQGAINQIMGGDIAALFLVAPVSVFAGILAFLGHRAAPVLALGPSVFAMYTYTQLALGADIHRYPGNSERFFLLYLALFILGGVVASRMWAVINTDSLPATSRSADRWLGWFLLVVAAFLVVGLHLRGLVDALSASPSANDYLADPGPFWLVKFMDLGIVMPGMAAIGIGILRGSKWAVKAKYAAASWLALLGSAVAGMAIVMQLTGDPAATVANTVSFVVFAAVGLATAVGLYRKLFSRRSAPDRPKVPRGQGEPA
jgi:hypothetical protein